RIIPIHPQTTCPQTIQVYLSGHERHARQLDKAKIGYQLQDNAFLALDDAVKAQKLSDRLHKLHWPRILDAFAKRVNPLLEALFKGLRYNWVIDQAEYATDILFQDQASLQTLY